MSHWKYVAAHNTNEASISACAAGFTDFRLLPTPYWSDDIEQKPLFAIGSPYIVSECAVCRSCSDLYVYEGDTICVECLTEKEIKP